MGGNALKHVGVETERKSATEYFHILSDFVPKLSSLFPDARVHVIQAYRTKPSFGDADILLSSDYLPPNWTELVQRRFNPHGWMPNSGVFSFDYCKMQIDLITVSNRDFYFAATYFAFNDLGNLMGRIAHKMGFKYGHNGLWKLLRDGTTTNTFAEILVSCDVAEVFAFLGYDYARYLKGFETLEDIFVYAASSPYFHRDIFALHNRNNISRVRDAKRPTYTAFLKWIEDKPELDRYTKWHQYVGDKKSPERDAVHAHWLAEAFKAFSGFQEAHEEELRRKEKRDAFKIIWNGNIVRELAGLQGKELGDFMTFCRDVSANKPGMKLIFEDLILTCGTDAKWLELHIGLCKRAWDERKGETNGSSTI